MGVIVGNPVRFAWQNRVEPAATAITANSSLATLPWNNVKNQIPSKAGRTGTTTELELTFDMIAAVSVQQVAILNHNFTTAATVTLAGATNSAFSPTAISLGLTSVIDLPILGEFSALQTYRYWRLTVSDATNPDGYLEIGHVSLGPYDEFDLPDFESADEIIDPSIQTIAVGGAQISFAKEKYRIYSVPISPIQQADRRQLMDTIFKDRGTTRGFYLFLDPLNKRDNENPATGLDGLHRYTILGVFNSQPRIRHLQADWQRFDVFDVRELVG